MLSFVPTVVNSCSVGDDAPSDGNHRRNPEGDQQRLWRDEGGDRNNGDPGCRGGDHPHDPSTGRHGTRNGTFLTPSSTMPEPSATAAASSTDIPSRPSSIFALCQHWTRGRL